MAQSNINARAQAGFAKADAYDKHRPTYGQASVQLLLEQCRVAGLKNAQVVDLAAGTGKFTELLAAREEHFEIIAIEPHNGMREVLTRKNLQGVSVRSGTAQALGLPDESVDAVFVAQGFHWFATADTLKELHRVLKPHGMLGLIWNIEVAGTFDDNEPRFRHEKWREVFDQQLKSTPLSLIIAADPLFSLPLAEHEEHFETWLSKDKVWDRFSTLSQIASLEGEAHEQTHKTFLAAINDADVETNEAGEVALHGRTITVWTSKVPAAGRSTLTGVERDKP